MVTSELTGVKSVLDRRQGVCLERRIAWLVSAILLFGLLSLPGAEIDRLLVSVNGSVITEGDLYIAGNLNPLIFSDGRTDAAPRGEEIDRLIDLELLRQETQNFSMDSEDESSLDAKVKEWQDRMTEAGIVLDNVERLGIRKSELNSYLRLRISVLEFVKYRFGPFAGVSESEIEAYYKDTYVPQLRESGLEIPPPAQVWDRIEDILRDNKINEALDQWMREARQNAQIEYFDDEGAGILDSENSRGLSRPAATE